MHINLEKIIYLENWTNTEERINIDDRFLNVYFAPFKKDNDKTVGVIAVLQDITEHVKLKNTNNINYGICRHIIRRRI